MLPRRTLGSTTTALLLAACAALASPAAAAPPAAPPPPAPEEVRFAGEVPLGGLLFLPPGEGPFPAAVVIRGSGPGDRGNSWATAVAETVREAGLAVLLADKRGSGAAGGDWRSAGFDELAADALAAVGYLAGRPDVDARRIGLVGLSQGGWIAPLAASRSPRVAFVVVVSGASVSFAEQSFHEMAATARGAGLPEAQVREVIALNQAAGRYLAGGPWEPYEAARRRGLERPWAAIAEGFPATPEAPIWTFLRKVADFDPIPSWLLVDVPVFVAYGAEDERDNVPVAASVERLERAFAATGHDDHEILVLPGLGHGLIDAERRELAAAFTEPLLAWLRRVTAPAAAAEPGG